MLSTPRLLALSAGALLGIGVLLGVRRVVRDRDAARLQADLLARAAEGPTPDRHALADLPEPARRYLRHAIPPDAEAGLGVTLTMTGTMAPAEDAAPLDLKATEVLAPPHGFVWTAHARMGPLPVRIRDRYADGEGSLAVEVLGLVPVARADDADVARSARHRLAAEAVWCPTALRPGPGVAWEAVDDRHARFVLTLDGEVVPVTLTVDAEGRLEEVRMQRYGDVGVERWQLIPYGFEVLAEQRFDGVAIPTRLRGGWWYGTDRYDPDGAATFEIQAAQFVSRPLFDSGPIVDTLDSDSEER